MNEFILKFAPDKLFEEFANQYIHDYGELKLDKVAASVKNSRKIDDYINQISDLGTLPTPKVLHKLIISDTPFVWAKQETFCLAALAIISSWQGYNYKGYDPDEDALVTRIMAETIFYFDHLKLSRSNNTFTRYYKRLLDIINLPE